MSVRFSEFARGVTAETAFTVLALAKQLIAAGKDVIELEIGDSPFASPESAKLAAVQAVEGDQSHYCPSAGLPPFRKTIAEFVQHELGIPATAEHVVVAAGAKIFEVLFCEAFVDPGDGVLVFSPYFPTYLPNIARRGGRVTLSALEQAHDFRPNLADIERFVTTDPQPRAIFLNSPHNPTGGVATQSDLAQIADLIRDREIYVFSDEPYQHMVWRGKHATILAEAGMFEQCVAAYTFSKSYSMSGYRLGYAVTSPVIAKMLAMLINTSLSCTPPIIQFAGQAALLSAREERDVIMGRFREKVELLVAGLNQVPGVKCLDPAGTFYAFPNVASICNRLGITSHGLALFLLEAADDQQGVACLGGECFGAAGGGFLRFSCAEPNERLRQAIEFVGEACERTDKVKHYLERRPEFRLQTPYGE